MNTGQENVSISAAKLKKVLRDPVKTAKAVNLVYVRDSQHGITRKRKGTHFSYWLDGTLIKEKSIINRIKKLVIPPAWENVWISIIDNGHLQATGLDSKKRKQYHYHPSWNALRNKTKFYRLLEFGNILPKIRLQLERDLTLSGLPFDKVMALIVSVMERTNIRIGNSIYKKMNGSVGISTLNDKHVKIKGSVARFTFVGKKGISHDITLENRKLATLVKRCKDIPGQELFQFIDDDGQRHSVDSGMVNQYIHKISGGDFTAKDFRTWGGSVNAILAFKEAGFFNTLTETKKTIIQVLDKVSVKLGNTRMVCKKYYVHPVILSLYENKGLEKYMDELDQIEVDDNHSGLTASEKVLLKLLETN